jgi:tetratricopeptide (TPR) repeat protein
VRRGKLTIVALAALVAGAMTIAGCAANQAFTRGTDAAKVNEWDIAVDQLRRAVQLEPKNAEYRMALARAMSSGSLYYAEQGRNADARGQLDVALAFYRKANEFDPSNRQLAAKVADLERKLRDQTEAARAKPTIDQLRESAKQAGPPPLLRFNEVLPAFQYNTTVREILNAIGLTTGVNVTYERQFAEPRPQGYQIQMDGVTLEQALNTVMSANQLFYKVLTPNTILVINDNAQNRLNYEDQLIKVLRLSNADASEVMALINATVRMPGPQQNQFQLQANKTQNTLTMRAPANLAAVIERVVSIMDKPRAEVIVDVEILEVNRRRVQQYGLDLGDYAIGVVFSPEASPITGTGLAPQPFNLATLRGGIELSDFYLAVPAATIRFLEADTETKILAKPQLRGAEGETLRLELGEETPIPSTTFTPLAAGGANVNPLSTFTYRAVGVILTIIPRVTYDDNIILELQVENSVRTGDTNIAGTIAPTFAIRRVAAKLRLRDGESNLLAGLVQEADRRSLKGIPGLLRLPIIKQLFSANDNTIEQTDVIVLLTPRIVRTHELKPEDFAPLFIGTPNNLGLGGPAPLIAQPPLAAPAPAQPGAAGAPPAPGAVVQPAPGAVGVLPVPVPGAPATPTAPGAPTQPVPGATGVPPAAPAAGAAPPPAAAAPLLGSEAQVRLMPGATDVRIGPNALAVPIAIAGTRLSSLTLTVTYNPAVLRVRAVQEATFMRSAGGAVAFTEDHANPGRIDIVVLRPGDTTGANGTGTVAFLLFDAIAAGPANLTITGTATAPGGAPLPLQFPPPQSVVVK